MACKHKRAHPNVKLYRRCRPSRTCSDHLLVPSCCRSFFYLTPSSSLMVLAVHGGQNHRSWQGCIESAAKNRHRRVRIGAIRAGSSQSEQAGFMACLTQLFIAGAKHPPHQWVTTIVRPMTCPGGASRRCARTVRQTGACTYIMRQIDASD